MTARPVASPLSPRGSPIAFVLRLFADIRPDEVTSGYKWLTSRVGRMALITWVTTTMDVRGDLPPVGAGEGENRPDDQKPRLLVDRALEIAEAGVFREANVDAVFDIARIMREIRVPTGYVFWRRGEAHGTSVRIVSGTVRCTDGEGRSVVAGHDYMLGSIAASARRPHGYDAVAETDVRAFLMNFEDWLIVLEAHPELALRFLGQLATTLSATLNR